MKIQKYIRYLVTAGLIGALYAAFTMVSSLLGFAYGSIQFRLSEALTLLPVVTPAAIPGLTIGCFLSNLGSPYGAVDMICGTAATLLGACVTYALRNIRFRSLPVLSTLGPILCNGIICGIEIALFMPETVTFQVIAVSIASVGLGEVVMCCGLGLPFTALIEKIRRYSHV